MIRVTRISEKNLRANDDYKRENSLYSVNAFRKNKEEFYND